MSMLTKNTDPAKTKKCQRDIKCHHNEIIMLENFPKKHDHDMFHDMFRIRIIRSSDEMSHPGVLVTEHYIIRITHTYLTHHGQMRV